MFFTEVRPSPWRQGVDLANMLLVLPLHAEFLKLLPAPPRPIAIQRFTPRRIGLTFVVLVAAVTLVTPAVDLNHLRPLGSGGLGHVCHYKALPHGIQCRVAG